MIPEGIGVTREGWLASGWCGPNPETDSRPHGRCAPERAVLRSGQPRGSPSPGRGRWGETRRSSLLTVLRGIRQHHRSSGAGGSRPAPSGMIPAETAAGWTTRGSAFRGTARPEAARLYSSGHTKARRSGVRFRCSRRSTPSDFLRRPLPDIRPKTDGSPSRRSPGPEPV